MKFVAAFLVFLVIGNCSGQTNPMAWNRDQRSRQNNQEVQNEVLVNTDRLMSSLESRLQSIVRSETNVLKQQWSRIEQSNSHLENALGSMKNDIAALKTATDEVQVETNRDKNTNEDNRDLKILINTMLNSINKVEREILIVKKNTRTINSWKHNNHQRFALVPSIEESRFGEQGVCSSSDSSTGSGIRRVRNNFFAFCEVNLEEESGWIVIQNRFDGSTEFLRPFKDYQDGFGNIYGEFWMGLSKIHELTSSRLHELMIVMENFDGTKKNAKYSAFAISDESTSYALNILGKYSGEAGDSLSYHAGMKFSTYDNDNDMWSDGNCAKSHFGGWWYNSCDESNLNGRYFENGVLQPSNNYQGIYWGSFVDSLSSLKSVKMMIRPVEL